MKNVKKIRQLTMRLKMQWKILIGVLVSGVACGGVLIFANADSSVSLSLTPVKCNTGIYIYSYSCQSFRYG